MIKKKWIVEGLGVSNMDMTLLYYTRIYALRSDATENAVDIHVLVSAYICDTFSQYEAQILQSIHYYTLSFASLFSGYLHVSNTISLGLDFSSYLIQSFRNIQFKRYTSMTKHSNIVYNLPSLQ